MTYAALSILGLALGVLAGFHVGRVYQASITRKAIRQAPTILTARSIRNYEGRQR